MGNMIHSSECTASIELHKPTKRRVRHARPWASSVKAMSRTSYRDTKAHIFKPQKVMNLTIACSSRIHCFIIGLLENIDDARVSSRI